MGSEPLAGSAVSTNNASNTLRTPHLKYGQHSRRHLCGRRCSVTKLERQISNLSREIERQSGGLLDQRDAAVDLRLRRKHLLETS